MLDDSSGFLWEAPVTLPKSAKTRAVREVRDIRLPETDWCPPDFPELDMKSGLKAVDVETYDVGLNTNFGPGWAFPDKGKVIGVSVAHENGFVGYFPIAHERGGNLPRSTVLNWLKEDVLSGGTVIGHNLKYDLGWLRREGVTLGQDTKIDDTMILAALTHSEWNSFALDKVSKELGRTGKSKTLLYDAAKAFGHTDPMKVLHLMPPGYVGPYGEGDVIETLAVYKMLRPLVDQYNLNYVHQLELDVLPCLLEMRWRGVPVDCDLAESSLRGMQQTVKDLASWIKSETKCAVDPWDATSIAHALRAIGVQTPVTATGNPSVTQVFLDSVQHPVADAVRKMRSIDKTTQFFVGHILGHAVNGRIHCELNQMRDEEGFGTVTGRMSCQDPNLQQIPSRTPEGRKVREAFIANRGFKWSCFDYSSQEPRWTVHWAAVAGLPGAAEAVQKFIDNPYHDFHQWAAELFNRPRKTAKALFLGVTYCKGGASLCDELGLPTYWVKPPKWNDVVDPDTPGAVRIAGEEGKVLINTFNDELPFLKKFQKKCEAAAEHFGYILTASGRRVSITNSQFNYKAVNYKIQGSAADQMKDGMRKVFQAGFVPALQVHDELDFVDVHESDLYTVRKLLEEALHGSVPSIAEAKIGLNWANMEKWNG